MKIYHYILLLISITINAQNINVNTNYTAVQLVKDIFLGSDCIEVDLNSIEINGFNNSTASSYGYFDRGNSNFPLANGILLSTGNIFNAPGPNNNLQSFTSSNWEGDRDLETALDLRANTTFDATTLEFDFISNQDNQINFEYIFASEQYLRSLTEGRCGYTDGFAFLIKEADSDQDYSNIAVIPNTFTPVSVNTIFGYGGACNPINPTYFRQFNIGNTPTNFNGETVVLNATANVILGKKYHLKLVIADQGNGLYDSGVFLKAQSFTNAKNLGQDLLIENGTALCANATEIIDATTNNATAYKWFRNGIEITNEISSTLTVTQPGFYEVEITMNTGCTIKGNKRIEYFTESMINQNLFTFCDDNFDGIIPINLNDYRHLISENNNNSFHLTYQDATANINAINQIELTTNQSSITLYFRLQSATCPSVIYPITFAKNQNTTYNPVNLIEICATDLTNNATISLEDYIDLFGVNFSEQVKYFATENDAKNNRNQINETQNITANQTFYVRFKADETCEVIAPLSFIVKPIKKSDTLIDQFICKDATTTLDAGLGFDSYLWLHNNTTTPVIHNVTEGTYQVRLEHNGCFYTQTVNVTAIPNPIITSINIQTSTITINVTGENGPFLYALDNGSYQTSNTFYNVALGEHIVNVKSAQLDCNISTKTFNLIAIANFISPNGDGLNDRLNLSQLLTKEKPQLKIYDRYGFLIFEGSLSNQFIWDGTKNGEKLASDSYWYDAKWTEPNTNTLQHYTNWILLKNKS